ncbi:MAG: type II secretion system secretin GspD [Desulforhabdus sp.]|jgi:general secretion pathway protein D|nr:type II secretion system secretin GspD [Desulforhabdus sp.]
MRAYKAALLLLLAIFLGSCASRPKAPPTTGLKELADASARQAAPDPSKYVKAPPTTAKTPAVPAFLNKPAQQKTGLMTPALPPQEAEAATVGSEKQKIILNYDKADVAEVTAQIFGDYLKLNYVLDPALQGRISLYLEGELTKQELLQLVTKAYAASNISIVPRNGIYYIQSIQRSTSSSLPFAEPFSLEKGQGGIAPIIVMYRLRYVDVKQAINTIKLFITPGRPITTDPLTNSIIFAEEPDNARTIVDILRSLDVNILQEVGMEVVPLQALSPEEAVKSIESLMTKLDIFKEDGLKTDAVFIPLERYGGVLVLAQNPEVLQTAKRWLMALDVKGQETGEQVYVYFAKNGLAKDIGDILNQVFKTGGKSDSKKPSEKIVSATEAPAQQAKAQVSEGISISTTLTGEVVIIADEVNNALVIRANAADYGMISGVVEALDIVPRAVLIEVMLAEIELTNDLQYGVQWYIKEEQVQNALKTGATNFQNIDLRTASLSGYAMFWDTANLKMLINALADKTNVSILSTPTLLASDNQEASITVGGKEPIQTGQTVTEGGTTVTSTQYEETGIILNVTPHINEGGQVRLEIEQTIRQPQAAQFSSINSPGFSERKIKTTLLAKDGQTVVIGGIIQHRKTDSKSGIPFLQDVPLISPLFGSTSTKYTRTELIIAITPHVIISRDEEVRETNEFLQRLQSLKSRIERRVR